jgi:hypothetical protein
VVDSDDANQLYYQYVTARPKRFEFMTPDSWSDEKSWKSGIILQTDALAVPGISRTYINFANRRVEANWA